MDVANSSAASGSRAPGLPAILKWLFCIWVLSLAAYQFSENTADPDLWGHTLFGQEMLKSGTLEKSEPYSWTAAGHPWINHEIVSEVALGAAHNWLGGGGILLLKMFVGMLTFVLALRLGAHKLPWPTQAFAWGFGALAVVELSFGFSPRPQIFTALALVCELWILKKIHDRSFAWAILLPILFAVWINTHGGVLAGVGLIGVAAGATTLQFLISKSRSNVANFFETPVSTK
ncbi:MAG: hypothetical protein JWM68_2383, partial [Verrucomicrobiales bacterium]|nr:hypothetical protein [Verrucomicrobiales bacterium]